MSALFFRDRQPESRLVPAAVATKYGEKAVTATSRFGKNMAVLSRIQQPVFASKPVARIAAQSWVVTLRRTGREVTYGVNRARPFARRRFRTRRPALVAIRARKPWVRARLILLG